MRSFAISLAAVTLAGGLASAAVAGESEASAVKDAVTAFAVAGDTQDLAAMTQVLHPEFRVVFVTKGQPGLTVLPRATYLSMLEAGKLGGSPRTVTFGTIDSQDGLAVVHAEMQREGARFHSTLNLAQVDGAWQVVQDAVVFQPL